MIHADALSRAPEGKLSDMDRDVGSTKGFHIDGRRRIWFGNVAIRSRFNQIGTHLTEERE